MLKCYRSVGPSVLGSTEIILINKSDFGSEILVFHYQVKALLNHPMIGRKSDKRGKREGESEERLRVIRSQQQYMIKSHNTTALPVRCKSSSNTPKKKKEKEECRLYKSQPH